MLKKVLKLALFFLIFRPLIAEAQSPSNFFSSDFARSPVERRQKREFNKPAHPLQAKKTPTTVSPWQKKDSGFFGKNTAVKKDSPANDRKQPEKPGWVSDAKKEESAFQDEGLEVRYLGVIVNFSDSEHFKSTLKELTDVVIENDFGVGNIYTVGLPFSKINMMTLIKPLLVRGAVFKLRGTPPEEYKVKLSPAWLVATEKGIYVLEGVRPLRKFFNSKGRFIDRTKYELMGDMEVVMDKTEDADLASQSGQVQTANNDNNPRIEKKLAGTVITEIPAGLEKASLRLKAASDKIAAAKPALSLPSK
ncbi:MAG: hypothetical protein D6719_02485 [Candidatus Dadabacteria bacterium]|nr:MAG: hypothetical protein D6719_02485 [Candidatus Dadabacteria bacterium]